MYEQKLTCVVKGKAKAIKTTQFNTNEGNIPFTIIYNGFLLIIKLNDKSFEPNMNSSLLRSFNNFG